MQWFSDLIFHHSVAHTILVLSIVIASGVALGDLRIRGIGLGIAGVMFTGLAMAHFGFVLDMEILEFCREFGLILFVYTVGMQVGPSFFASFKKQGLKLNLLAGSVVLLGATTAVVLHFITGTPVAIMVGILSGAVTNTPGLGAATQALREAGTSIEATGMGYAVAYPFGIIGIILVMIGVRFVFKINVSRECEEFENSRRVTTEIPRNHNLIVTNPNVVGKSIRVLSDMLKCNFVISRLMRGEQIYVPSPDTVVELNDLLHVVCSQESASQLSVLIGTISETDIRNVSSQVVTRGIVVTHKQVVGKTIGALNLTERHNVTVTRISRAGLDLIASKGIELAFGDRLTVVGCSEGVSNLALEMGDSVKELNHPNILPIFLGIMFGIMLGSIPFSIPGIPAPVKLGLAGGPLLVALLFSRLGRVGPVLFYLPQGANFSLREVGITLFLACVGLKSGGKFVETLLAGDGVYWMAMGAIITLLPLLIVSVVARVILKVDYMTLCGLLAGSMTDPPALSFANQIASSDAPSITYASVYALTMFLRILTAQAIVLLLV